MKNKRTECSESVTGRELQALFANTMANAWVDSIDLQLEMHEWLTSKEAGVLFNTQGFCCVQIIVLLGPWLCSMHWPQALSAHVTRPVLKTVL